MRILILGATGFIGRNLVEHFANLGHDVHAACYQSPKYYTHKVMWHRCDLRDAKEVKYLLSGMDIVIQAAATTSGSKDICNTPAVHVTDNVVMNAYIFRAAVEAGVKHVVFFSCSTMFSNGEVTEDSPIDIHPKYFGVAHTKLYNEKMCEFYSRVGETKFTVLRHSNIYGPHDKYDLEKSHVFGATVTKVMQAKDTVTIWGTGEEARDLLYVSDLCDFVEVAVEKQTDKFKLYNCGYGIAITINDLVDKIVTASGKALVIQHDLSAPSIPTSLSLNCDKARAELRWWPKVTLDRGIEMTLEWYKGNIVHESV